MLEPLNSKCNSKINNFGCTSLYTYQLYIIIIIIIYHLCSTFILPMYDSLILYQSNFQFNFYGKICLPICSKINYRSK
jgi:hypothetical protein